jgi:PPM family protein phosphatase
VWIRSIAAGRRRLNVAIDLPMKLLVAVEIRSGGRNEDRAAFFESEDAFVIVLADGAGGVGSGAASAETVVRAAQDLALGLHSSPEEALFAADISASLLGGLSTGVIAVIKNGEISGASSGDSEAWLVGNGNALELTRKQFRKPLLGGGARAVPFGPAPFRGRLLVASDGLTKYVKWSAALICAMEGTPSSAAVTLVELPRLSNGKYQDDVSVIVAGQV